MMRVWKVCVTVVGIAALAFVCAGNGSAGDKASEDKAEGTSAEFQRLFKLEGKWKIEEVYPPEEGSNKSATGKGSAAFDKSLDDKFLIGDYKSRSREIGTDVKAHIVFTYDEDQKQYHCWWFDNYHFNSINMGQFVGRYSAKKNAIIFVKEPQDAETNETIRHTYTFRSDGTVVLTMEFETAPNTYELYLTTTFTAKGKKASEGDKPKARLKRARGIRP